MRDIPRSRDVKHPLLRRIFMPFYETRMERLQRNRAATAENRAAIAENRKRIKRARSERAYVKQLKKDGTLR